MPSSVPQSHVRNFCIIAHIDHGKSTLADRLLEMTNTVEDRDMQDQVLDRMDLERERGITIKLQAVRLNYETGDGLYELNLIDTPGHVDFSYEVSRSLKACEGALLLVDAVQGVEAQTVANLYLAIEEDLEIIPVINKIDLENARTEEVKDELVNLIGCDREEIITLSAKTGENAEQALEAVVDRVSPPSGDPGDPLQALVFDSHYDNYLGVVTYLRVFQGSVAVGDQIELMGSGARAEVKQMGYFDPEMVEVDELGPGEVGYLTTGIKDIKQARVGDTITRRENPAESPLEGYRPAKPMVFCGMYPSDSQDFRDLEKALEKLSLNDAALSYRREKSEALGLGFRAGFLGMLHQEVIQERIEREYDVDLVATSPSVVHKVHLHGGEVEEIENPGEMPDKNEIEFIEEPVVDGNIICPVDYMSRMIELMQSYRGELGNMEYLAGERVQINGTMPLSEILLDFYDRMKSASRGRASFDYQQDGFQEADLVKVDILVNKEPVDSLSFLCHRDKAESRGRAVCKKLKETIPRQLFPVPLQASNGKRIIARETIPAARKDVTAKCYGGDITRKRKLLEEQREGKKRLKKVGDVDIPQEAFMSVLKIGEDD